MNYEQYLKTHHWKSFKKNYFKKKKRICKICESEKDIHLHHKYYVNKFGSSILNKEHPGQVLPLCKYCHSTWHATHKNKRIRAHHYTRAKLLLMLGLTRKQAILLCINGDIKIPWLRNKIKEKCIFPAYGNKDIL